MLLRLAGKALDKSILFSFDRTGFRRHSRRFRPGDLEVDLGGKRCLVTGANSGLGLATARALARLGGEVWLLCRDEVKGRRALEQVRSESTGPLPRLERVDLASRSSMEDFLTRFGDTAIDVLIHNAGVLPAFDNDFRFLAAIWLIIGLGLIVGTIFIHTKPDLIQIGLEAVFVGGLARAYSSMQFDTFSQFAAPIGIELVVPPILLVLLKLGQKEQR